MSQPKWEFIANLGDAAPVEHGGYLVYKDTTGVYGYEADKLDPPEDTGVKGALWRVYRVRLERQKLVRHEDKVYLVPFTYEETWPHPVHAYPEWFVESLGQVAEYVGAGRIELESALCSDDPSLLSWAYQCIGDFHGWANLDSNCLLLTKKEVKKRYSEELK